MKVFISWSGDISLKVAQLLREWLPCVINSIEPYVSSEDIDKGARWSTDIAKELENSTFGILCVTKDNFEAPWLSFEAGALSKTMEKSFVTPFLFDIKRSEVKGPILQFQSTILDKEDIKKMVKTLNKACGDSGIPENRLEKSFDVWFPTLEDGLNKLKNSSINCGQEKETKHSNHSSEILEEILELSRNNQKLLKNPDVKLYNDVEKIKITIDEISKQNIQHPSQKRINKRYIIRTVEELMCENPFDNSYKFLMILSLFREDFPWIYYMGRELIDILKNKKSPSEKAKAIREFRNLIDYTFNNYAMRELMGYNRESTIVMEEISHWLSGCIEEIA